MEHFFKEKQKENLKKKKIHKYFQVLGNFLESHSSRFFLAK